MKTNHDGDCTIYFALINERPEDGICTCGYGLQVKREHLGDDIQMYSPELRTKLTKQSALENLSGGSK